MRRKAVAVGWAVTFMAFCIWSVFFGFRSEMAPAEAVPPWCSYQHPLSAGTRLGALLENPLVRCQLVAAGYREAELSQSNLMAAVRRLDQGALMDSICARLRVDSGEGDVWVYAARLSLSARLLHWQTVGAHREGITLIGRHDGWPIWKLEESASAEAQPVYFTFADGMLLASMGWNPAGVFDLLDQYDGLIP